MCIRDRSGALLTACQALKLDAAAWGRVKQMHALTVAKDFVALEAMRLAETNENVLVILRSPVPDVEIALRGVMLPGDINVLCRVRGGVLMRLIHHIFPEKPKRSEAQRKAMQRVLSGRVEKLNMLSLIDRSGAWTAADPLKGFATMKVEEGLAALLEALMLESSIVQVASPAQASEASGFYRALGTLITTYIRTKKCPWSLMSTFWAELREEMAKPAVLFSQGGGGDGGLLVYLDETLLRKTSPLLIDLREALLDWKQDHKGGPPPPPSGGGGGDKGGGKGGAGADAGGGGVREAGRALLALVLL